MPLEKLQSSVRHYMEMGGRIGPDRSYNQSMQDLYHKEFKRTYIALDKLLKRTGRMATMERAADFIRNDTVKSRSLGGKEAIVGDAGADATITFCIEKLKVKFPGLR